MFEPVLYRLKVKPDPVEEKTEGGIFIPQDVQKKEQVAGQTGTVISFGSTCFDGQSTVDVGDRILFARYAGILHREADGHEYRFMNDEDVIAVEKGGNNE